MDNATAIRSQVKGFLVPVFTDQDPNTGRQRNGLTYDDFEKVRTGYACADCLAEFSTYTVTCPVCGLSRNVAYDLGTAPDLWNQHYAERNSDEPVEKPPVVNPLEGIRAIQKDPNVEQIPLSKLRKRRR